VILYFLLYWFAIGTIITLQLLTIINTVINFCF